jgi:hypothetical protein
VTRVDREIARLEIPLPRVWLDRLQSLAREQGKSIEEITREAIATYLGVSSLEMEIIDLKREMKAVSSLSMQISDLNRRLCQLEAGSLPIRPIAVDSEDDGEYEDEPDEILNDFLQG